MIPQTELDVLDPPRQTLRVAGEEIEVMPLTIGRVGAVMRALGPAMDEVRAKHRQTGKEERDQEEDIDLLDLLSRHTGEAIGAVAAATDKPWKWVAALPPDEFLELAGLLIEVNADFFSRHLEPSLKRTTARLQAAAGRISPPSSPAPDTESAR